jgi:HCOMODA/2-hydroxy-3-carboxy-muconic semialdehyde decarboxylase
VSARHDRDPNRYLIARYLAPELVTSADILELDLDSRPVGPPGQRMYSEIFLHGEIYKARPDVKAIVHTHSPAVIPFGISGVPLRPSYHMSSFIGLGVPVFDIRKAMGESTEMMIRNPERGRALARALGDHPAALLRGHGAVVVAGTIPRVEARSIYLQTNATLQLQAMALGSNLVYLDAEEARKVEKDWDAYGFLKAWELWKKKALAK